jgi:hypothetical protein
MGCISSGINDVNLLGGNIYTIKKNTEVDVEKKKYIDTMPVYILPPSHCTHEQNRNSTCNFNGNTQVKCHPCWLPSTNIYVPLSIIMKSNTEPCSFVSTEYTDNSLEYFGTNTVYKQSVITNKTCSSNKPFIVTWGGSWAII